MKALLLILGLTFTLGAFATEGEHLEGCGAADELKGCECITQTINPVDKSVDGDKTTGDTKKKKGAAK